MDLKNYNVFKIYSNPFQPDLISGLLWELEITGITEEENHLIIFADEKAAVSEERINKYLEKLKSEKLIDDYSIVSELLPDKNWNELWEKGREVIRISDKFVIKPTFKEYKAQPGEIVLTIDPKMSFGTGEHQSTKLIIKLLEKYVRPGICLLDVGSGTGILSIAAIKLGAAKTVAVDNDERCYENCIENCELNSVNCKVKIVRGEISNIKENNFDLIIANIHKDVLLNIADQIIEKLKPKGIVILSGLLLTDKEDIEEHYTKTGFETLEIETMDEWIAMVLKR
ncbi:MAG: 50S ribosomal protein L11 methyltransferase [Ignavibacteriae bacterium]|nr:MAG: 50S ribosomal protein L11 methyltransferase [Ignavibacteriota bacterium]